MDTLMYAITTGDSAVIRRAAVSVEKAALVATRFFVDTAMRNLSINRSVFCIGFNMCVVPAVLWPRMMLLRADLEVAKGRPEDAKIWYDKLLDLWSTADVEFQSMVERVRKARAALGK